MKGVSVQYNKVLCKGIEIIGGDYHFNTPNLTFIRIMTNNPLQFTIGQWNLILKSTLS